MGRFRFTRMKGKKKTAKESAAKTAEVIKRSTEKSCESFWHMLNFHLSIPLAIGTVCLQMIPCF